MLTEKAMRERMWGQFPALRMILEPKRVPDQYYGPTTVSDNVFDRVQRLLTMAILVHENRRELLQSLKSEFSSREADERLMMLRRDLEHLHDKFCRGSELFEAAISELENEFKVWPAHERVQKKRTQRHGIFALALILSWYCEKFGEIPDSDSARLFIILNTYTFGHQGEEAKRLYAKAREWKV